MHIHRSLVPTYKIRIACLSFSTLWCWQRRCFRGSYTSFWYWSCTVLRLRSCVAFHISRELPRDPIINEQIHFSLNPSQPRADPLPIPYSINWPLKSRAIFHSVRLLSLERIYPWDQKLWTSNATDSISFDSRSSFLFVYKYLEHI